MAETETVFLLADNDFYFKKTCQTAVLVNAKVYQAFYEPLTLDLDEWQRRPVN